MVLSKPLKDVQRRMFCLFVLKNRLFWDVGSAAVVGDVADALGLVKVQGLERRHAGTVQSCQQRVAADIEGFIIVILAIQCIKQRTPCHIQGLHFETRACYGLYFHVVG